MRKPIETQRNDELQLITEVDEKWIIFYNNVRSRSQSKQAKVRQAIAKRPKTVMLCIYWNLKEIVHCEVLLPGKTFGLLLSKTDKIIIGH